MRSHARRAVGLLALVVTALGLGAVPAAEANQPCGFVKYKIGNGGSWHQVPHVPYCEPDDWCGGLWVHLPPDQVTFVHYEAFVCVPDP